MIFLKIYQYNEVKYQQREINYLRFAFKHPVKKILEEKF